MFFLVREQITTCADANGVESEMSKSSDPGANRQTLQRAQSEEKQEGVCAPLSGV